MKTLQEMLCDLQSEKSKGIIFAESGKQDEFCSYTDLYEQSLRLLGGLQALGIDKSDYVIMQVKSNKATVLLLWACLLGGVVAVPLTYARSEDSFLKLKNVSDVLQNAYIVGDNIVSSTMTSKGYFDGAEKLIVYDKISNANIGTLADDVSIDDVSIIQFSSGTTGIPKGVLLTNKNIATNLEAISIAAKLNRIPGLTDSGASWLPLTNDLGLVGFHLSGVYHKENIVMIDSMSFFFEPTILFEKIEKYKATVTINPNFALEYLLGYFVRQKGSSQKFDLSSLRLNICGSEPIKPQTVDLFEHTFSMFTLKNNTIFPVYGLAEACLAVSFSDVDNPYTTISLDRNFLSIGDEIKFTQDSKNSVQFVGVGHAVPGTFISVRNENNNEVNDGTVGIIYIKGDSITSGYINNEKSTKELFSTDGWLNTFDVGVVVHGSLYIIGRQKDMIILHGKNYYCVDLEKLIFQSITAECAVVNEFNIETKDDDIYVFVLQETDECDFEKIEATVKDVLNKHIGVKIKRVIFAKTFPRTEGGKVRRFLLKQSIQ